MGSLMPGWNSLSPKGSPKVLRTRSFTKEEIDEFWKKKRSDKEEKGGDAEQSRGVTKTQQIEAIITADNVGGDDGATQYSDLELNKLVLKVGGDDGATQYSDLELNKLNANTDWWTKSSWAFLNEPPLEAKKQKSKYISQFDVATSQQAIRSTHN